MFICPVFDIPNFPISIVSPPLNGFILMLVATNSTLPPAEQMVTLLFEVLPTLVLTLTKFNTLDCKCICVSSLSST